MHAIRPHLTVAGAGDAASAIRAASELADEAFRLTVECVTRQRPVLNRAAALRLDQAELFLLSLDTEMLTADNPRAAYLLGIAEAHLAGLIEVLRAVAA